MNVDANCVHDLATVRSFTGIVLPLFKLQYADFQEEENKAERYCWDDIAATLRI